MWIMFRVPCPTPSGKTAEELYRQRVVGITPAMQASAESLGCRFHRAWYVRDGSAFVALAEWETRDGADEFFTTWDIQDEEGEEAWVLEGDVGLVPLPRLHHSQ